MPEEATPTVGDGNALAVVRSGPEVTPQRDAEAELARQALRFQILAEASHAFAEVTLDFDSLVDVIVRRATEIIGDGATLNLLSEDGTWIRSVAAYTHDPELTPAYHAMLVATPARAGEGVAGRVIEQNTPLLVPEMIPETVVAASRPEYRDVVRRMNIHSLLIVPMRVRGAPIGSFTLYRNRPGHAYNEADQSLLQDLADRAALAVENARLHASLERRVAERTAELVTAMNELSSFSYSVSHDLRAPLRAVDGFTSHVLDDYDAILPADAKQSLARVRVAAARMSQIIDDLLNLSRVARAEVQRERVDVTAVAHATIDELRRAEPARSVTVTVADGLTAYCDARLLRIAFDNLLGNAWKFTSRRDAARIDVGVAPEEENDGGAFFVRDDGAGFDMAYARKMFGAFERFHDAKEFPGTGIGLATVQRIMSRFGGRIWAKSAPGKGATFFFTIPG